MRAHVMPCSNRRGPRTKPIGSPSAVFDGSRRATSVERRSSRRPTVPGTVDADVFRALFERCSNWGRWGADDERGTLNLITPERTARAAALVRTGETIGCARPLNTVADVENARPAVHLMLRAGDVADPAAMSSTSDYVVLRPHGPGSPPRRRRPVERERAPGRPSPPVRPVAARPRGPAPGL